MNSKADTGKAHAKSRASKTRRSPGAASNYGRAEQIYRDARALPIVGGTNEMCKYLTASADLPEARPTL